MNSQIGNTVVEFSKNSKAADSDDSISEDVPVFYTELKRRNVLRTAAAYVVVAWLVAQVADVLCDGFVAPDWVMRAVLIALAFGLPVAIIISWYFEFTASFKWETDTAPIGAIARQKGRKIDFLIISVLILIVSTLLVWRPEMAAGPETACLPAGEYSQATLETDRSLSSTGKTLPNKNTVPN